MPGGSADYDNVRVQAKADLGAGNGGKGGGNGGNGNGGNANGNGGGKGANGNGGNGANGGGGKLSGNGIVSRRATLRGDRLIVKVRCKSKPKARCKIQLQAKMSRHGANATNRRTARVRAGHKRRIALNVRNRYRSRLVARKRVVIKQVVRKGGKSATSYKKVRVNIHG